MRTAVQRGLAAAAVGAATVATVAAVSALNHRRWRRAADATGCDPFGLPSGTERTVTSSDGAQLWTLELDGPPDAPLVVLAHCWTGDHRIWAPVARRLAPDHRVVLYDQRGHGRSTIGTAGLTLEALGDDLAAVLASVGARGAVVAGHSMGGMTIHAYVAGHPDSAASRVGHVVLVATSADNDALAQRATTTLARTVGRPMVGRYVGGRATGPAAIRGVFGRRPALAPMRATAETFVATPAEVRAELIRAIGAMDYSEVLPTFALPADIVVGSRDALTPVARARRMHELWPGSTLEILPDHGHMLPLEAPDEVAAIIARAAGGGAPPAPTAPTEARAGAS